MLRGADLRGADLRGVDLRDANLRDADLRDVHTGLSRPTAVLFVSAGLLTSVALGVVSGLAGARVVGLLGSEDPVRRTLGLLLGAAIVELLASLVWKGGRFTLRAVLLPLVSLALIAGAIAVVTGMGSGAHAAAFGILLTLVVVVAVVGALARTAAGTLGPAAFFTVAIAGAIAGKLTGGGIVAIAIATAAMIAGRRALLGSCGFSPLERTATRLLVIRGTRFAGADLRGAHFDGARLVACDFRRARLDDFPLVRASVVEHCLFDDEERHPPRRV